MAKYQKITVFTAFFIFTLASLGLSQQEQITITTYYPSPYGSYNELYVATKEGIGTTTANVKLAVGGAGTNVYATDAWIENNMHVQGNETLTQGGRGRMRVGTAWGYVGLYADVSSTGANNDLVLGATSGQVRIGPNGTGQNLLVNGNLTVTGTMSASSCVNYSGAAFCPANSYAVACGNNNCAAPGALANPAACPASGYMICVRR